MEEKKKKTIDAKEVKEVKEVKPKTTKKKQNKDNSATYVIICVISVMVGVLIAILSVYLLKDKLFTTETSNNGACYTPCENKVTVDEKGISAAVDKIYDAVVLVENYKNKTLTGTGTGFVYKVDNKHGYILTNYHVINGNTELKVMLSDSTKIDAKYLGGDEYLDIAVLAIDKDKVLKVAEIAKTSGKLGDTVFTVGTPVDYRYQGTVTRGILSGKDRLVEVGNPYNSNESYVMKVLQTDAAVNPGNSGGPLVNANGEVIGIISLKFAKEEIEGMGFAIAIEDIMTHIQTFEKGEEVKRPFLGVSIVNVTDRYKLYQLGINVDTQIREGVAVVSVEKKSSVDGVLKAGDVITKIDKDDVINTAYLRYELFKHKIGDTIKITYIRDGKTLTSKVTLKGL